MTMPRRWRASRLDVEISFDVDVPRMSKICFPFHALVLVAQLANLVVFFAVYFCLGTSSLGAYDQETHPNGMLAMIFTVRALERVFDFFSRA